MSGEFRIISGTAQQIEQTIQGNMQSWSKVEVKAFVLEKTTSTGAFYTCVLYRSM